jgi:hypothetical protein
VSELKSNSCFTVFYISKENPFYFVKNMNLALETQSVTMLVRGFELVFGSLKRSHNHGLKAEQWRKIKHVNAPLAGFGKPR